ncbi:MAG TPA: hypothetical protein VFP17_08665 [Solirubrobacterales bacterium]|nr:hypothetical protein [Solirubrobacterales bacterium]
MLPKPLVIFALVLLAACPTVFGCAGSDGPTTQRAAATQEDGSGGSRQLDKEQAAQGRAKSGAQQKQAKYQPAQGSKLRSAQASKPKKVSAPGDEGDGHRRGSSGRAELSDEDACAQDPSLCETPKPDLDRSNPDVREAEAEGQGSSQPGKCHSQDCKEARAEGG